MKRTLISDTPQAVGSSVCIFGWVHNRRDHGKLIFLDIRDRTGIVQVVIIPDRADISAVAKNLRGEFVVILEGVVKLRPGGTESEKANTGSVEIECAKLTVIAKPKGDLPLEVNKKEMDIQLATLLNHRNLTLRNPKVNAIFRLYSVVLEAYANSMRGDGFMEIKTPKILSSATEGGANLFKLKYFNRFAFLAQSPQFYKQAGVGAFERVFEIGTVFRAEPHYTTRHVNEYTSFDAEMGFIENLEDIMKQFEHMIQNVFITVRKRCSGILEEYEQKITAPKIFPRMKLTEALDILKKNYGKELETVDIDPEGERLISEYVKKEYNSDFVFLTHYPTNIRPMYTMPSRDPHYTESFDVIYRGVEIATGGQRIHDYDKLVASMISHGLNPKDFESYLSIFRNGMPPHGGWGLGSERLVQKMLGLKNVREAILFPRDVKRLEP